MAGTEQIPISRRISLDEIDDRISDAKDGTKKGSRTAERLTFIRMRYRGFSVESAADALGINTQSGYNWQKLWNEGGPDALIPGFSGGRQSKMTEEQKERLRMEIQKEPLTTQEVRGFIMGRFHITYSEKQVHVILTKMGLRHAKPYQKDYQQPADAEERLKKRSPMLWMT